MPGEKEASLPDLLAELNGLQSMIKDLRQDVAAVRHPLAEDDRLDSAAIELDAIVAATEGATNGILETAEAIGAIAAELEGSGDPAATKASAQLEELVTTLFTQCSFQDITGQRVRKVVDTLNFIEQRVTSMIDRFGHDSFGPPPTSAKAAVDDEASLLNGPQAGGAGVSQSDIDKLFG